MGDSVILPQKLGVLWSCSMWDRRSSVVSSLGWCPPPKGQSGIRSRGWHWLEPLAERDTAVYRCGVLHVWDRPVAGSMHIVVIPKMAREDRVWV